MDPLSITVSVGSLLGLCVKVTSGLKEYRDKLQTVDSRVRGLIIEVECFTQTLNSMKETLADSQLQYSLRLTGHIGNHWRNISACIDDGLCTLESLEVTLDKTNKNVRMFDKVRKHLRYRDATEQISVFQQQIRSYRDTIQLSLQTAILWNQVTLKDAAAEATLPRLDQLSAMIRHLGTQINDRMALLENMGESPSKSVQINTLRKLQNCVQTSADVVSSASTTLGMSDTLSTIAPSDNLSLLPPVRNEVTRQWVTEVQNANVLASYLNFHGSVAGELDVVEDSDSEAEFDAEILQLQLLKGKEELQNGNSTKAERLLNQGISRLKQHRSRYLDTSRKVGVLQELIETYERQNRWDVVKRIKIEQITILSEDSPAGSNESLEEILKLVEVLLKLGDQNEARAYARKCVKAYRKLGGDGLENLKRALKLMIAACNLDGDELDEETYKAMLRNLSENELNTANLLPPPQDYERDEQGKSALCSTEAPLLARLSDTSINPANEPNPILAELEGDTPLSELAGGRPVLSVYECFEPLPSPKSTDDDQLEEETERGRMLPFNSYNSSVLSWTASLVNTQCSSSQNDDNQPRSSFESTTKSPTPVHVTVSSGSYVNMIAEVDPTIDDISGNTSGKYPEPPKSLRMKENFQAIVQSLHPTVYNTPATGPLAAYRCASRSQPTISEIVPTVSHRSADSFFSAAYCYNGSCCVLLRCGITDGERSLLSRRWLNETYPEEAETENFMLSYTVTQANGLDPKSFRTWFLVVDDETIIYDASLGQDVNVSRDTESLGPYLENQSASESDSSLPISISPNVSKESIISIPNDFEEENVDGYGAHQSLPPLSFTPANKDSVEPAQRVTSVIVGPNCCGKTSLIYQYLNTTETPTINNGFMVYTTITHGSGLKDNVRMVIWDTPGEIHDLSQTDAPKNVSCVVLCFSVDSPESIADIDSQWAPKIREIYPGCPIILAALRADLRESQRALISLAQFGEQPCTTSEGRRVRDLISAEAYFECSTKSGEAIKDLFDQVALYGLKFKADVQPTKGFWKLQQQYRKTMKLLRS